MSAFSRDTAVLLVIDIQEKLAPHIHEIETVTFNTLRMIRVARLLKLPIILTEQYPDGMGNTIAALTPDLAGCVPVAKRTFSCWRDPVFHAQFMALGRTHAILTGVETHVCVYQTGADLMRSNFHAQVVSDAVSSRTAANKAIGLGRLAAAGAEITSMESCVFELMGSSACPEFKEALKIVK